MLTLAGMEDQDGVDLLANYFMDAKLPGYIMAAHLEDTLSKNPDLSKLGLSSQPGKAGGLKK